MDNPISRFWDKYISITIACNVPDGARRWYVKHVVAFIKAHTSRRLYDLSPADVTKYLDETGRKPEYPVWYWITN